MFHNLSSARLSDFENKLKLAILCICITRPRMGLSGQNSVQAGAFWGGYFLGEHLLLEKHIPDLGFLGLSNAKYMKLS